MPSDAPPRPVAPVVATIGYEGATLPALLEALHVAGVTLLVDVRAVARSRRPGFAKTRLAAALAEAGISYRHLRGLGTPADGRAAARAGRHGAMQAIFRAHLATAAAQADLATLAALVPDACVGLLCFEADPRHCHRLLVAEALAARRPIHLRHLHPRTDPSTDAPD